MISLSLYLVTFDKLVILLCRSEVDDTGFQMLVKPIIQLYTVLVSTILTDLKSLGYNTNQMYIESLKSLT